MKFDHRLVLQNPHMGWPEDVLAEARAAHDAELRQLRADMAEVDTVEVCHGRHYDRFPPLVAQSEINAATLRADRTRDAARMLLRLLVGAAAIAATLAACAMLDKATANAAATVAQAQNNRASW